MSGAVISSNTSMKVNRAISSATTVNANCYAIVDYSFTSHTAGTSLSNQMIPAKYTVYVGPSQTVSSTFTMSIYNGAATYTITYSLTGGVEFINSP